MRFVFKILTLHDHFLTYFDRSAFVCCISIILTICSSLLDVICIIAEHNFDCIKKQI